MATSIRGNGLVRGLGAMLLAVLTGVLLMADGAAQEGPATSSGQPRNGALAVVELEDRLARVAQEHGMTADELRALLLTDQTLWVHPNGGLFYVEPAHDDDHVPEPPSGPVPPADHPRAPLFPLGQTFLLNSLPGSLRTIYLDFDGATVSGTAWAGGAALNAGPFTLDGSGAFSDEELERIQQVWAGVAEDFAPFDVNVTTQDPGFDAINRDGPADQVYGTRIVITSTAAIRTTLCPPPGTCGGIAFLGNFDRTDDHASRQPAWSFHSSIQSAASMIEVISHEVGHTLGLSHDGGPGLEYYPGHGIWGPIMGATGKAIVQWSRGEYPGANNPEDDFSVIASNGALPRADDHGNTTGAATVLPGPSFDVQGIIHTATDSDVFRVEADGGFLSATVDVSAVSANLDVQLQVLNAGGAVIATSNPLAAATGIDTAGGLAASLTIPVTAGVYYIRVEGIGFGTLANGYNDYGSTGQYRLHGAFDNGDNTCYSLDVAVAPPASGTVDIDPAENCPGGYRPGTPITLTANGAGPMTLNHWSGTLMTGGQVLTFGIAEDTQLTANFAASCVPHCVLAKITSPVPGTTLAGGTDTFTWAPGDEVTGYAVRMYYGSVFQPDVLRDEDETFITVTDLPTDGTVVTLMLWGYHPDTGYAVHAQAVYSAFNAACRTLTTEVLPVATGGITTDLAPNCGIAYAVGSNVTLTATPVRGYAFDQWTGDATGTNPQVGVNLAANRSVTANFVVAGDNADAPATLNQPELDIAFATTHAGTWGGAAPAVPGPQCDFDTSLTNDAWYLFTPAQDGTLWVSAAGSSVGAGVILYEGAWNGTQAGCAATGGTSAGNVSHFVEAGATFYIQVGAMQGSPPGSLAFAFDVFHAADVTCDHSVDAADAVHVLLVIAGLADALPRCSPDAVRDGAVNLVDALFARRVAAGLSD